MMIEELNSMKQADPFNQPCQPASGLYYVYTLNATASSTGLQPNWPARGAALTTSDASIYRRYRNIDSISIYRIVRVSIYRYVDLILINFTVSESVNESFSENFTTS